MRIISFNILLIGFLLTSCGSSSKVTLAVVPAQPDLTTSLVLPTRPSQPPTQTDTIESLTASSGAKPQTTTLEGTVTEPAAMHAEFMFRYDQPLIAFENVNTQDKILVLANPDEKKSYDFSLPGSAHFATPFMDGLSPDAHYFAYFEGGWIENEYGAEHLRINKADLNLNILDLHSGELIFTTPLLSPAFPHNLDLVATSIQDEWQFTSQNATFEDVVAATQEMMLDNIRRIAWSPDSSLLAYASQNPGPGTDLFFFDPESGISRQANEEPGHVLKITWSPNSSTLILITSLYDRHAREDTNYLLTRSGVELASFTSQLWRFFSWHDPNTAFLYGSTDSGDYFGLKTISAIDGTIHLLWDGSFADIAYSPDLSTFLISSAMPTAPIPPHPGLFLGRLDDNSLLNLSKNIGGSVQYWGSQHFAFAASSVEGGTIGISENGEITSIDDRFWRLSASPDGKYLVGYNRYQHGNLPGVVSGIRIFDGGGQLLESINDENVICTNWNVSSSKLAYQVGSQLFIWDTQTGSTRLISNQLDEEDCEFRWIQVTY